MDKLLLAPWLIHPAVRAARTYAIAQHGAQMYGDQPYVHHLDQVAANVFSVPEHTIAQLEGAYTHDLLEDVDGLSHEDVAKNTSKAAADIAYNLMGEGANRDEKTASTVHKITGNPDSIIDKMADRVANMEACVASGNKKLLSRYIVEMPAYDGLFSQHAPALYARFARFKDFDVSSMGAAA